MKIKSIAKALSVVAVGVSFVLSSGIATAAPITYTSEYTATVLPQNVTPDTVANPTWTYLSNGTPTVGVGGGFLSVSTSAAATNAFWLIGAGDSWNNTGTTTVDFTVKNLGGIQFEGSDPFSFQIASTGGYIQVDFFSDKIKIDGNPTLFTWDSSTLQTYRLVTAAGSYSLYSSLSPTAIFTGQSGSGPDALNRILFGDGSNSFTTNFELSHIGWNNTVAEFSSPIPEPSTLGFLVAGGVFSLVAFGRRRSQTAISI